MAPPKIVDGRPGFDATVPVAYEYLQERATTRGYDLPSEGTSGGKARMRSMSSAFDPVAWTPRRSSVRRSSDRVIRMRWSSASDEGARTRRRRGSLPLSAGTGAAAGAGAATGFSETPGAA